MPKLSEKGVIVPASPIRKLMPYAENAKKKGIKVYHLNIGQPDIETPTEALNAIRNYNSKVIEYGHSAGNISYRMALAEYYNSIGIDISYENVLVTTGGSEALNFLMMACLNPGDEIIVPEPFYTNYYSYAIQSNIVIRPITTVIQNGFALPHIDVFEKMITTNTKAILLCNPNNPTGYLYSRKELEYLRDIVKRHDLFLFCDEVYRDFCYDGERHISCLELDGLEEHAVLIDSTSKRFSMCGIRIGAIVTRNKSILESILRFSQARLCAPILGQLAAEAALKTPKEYFQNVHKEYTKRRNYLINALNQIEGVYCPMPKGAFYTIVKLPVYDAEHFAQWLLEEFNYNNQTLMLAPAAGFYASSGPGKDEVRIAYVLNENDLKKAVECLEEALKIYPYKKKNLISTSNKNWYN